MLKNFDRQFKEISEDLQPAQSGDNIQIQNALRILCRLIPPNTSIKFEGGDLVEVNDQIMRTQEVADYIKELKKKPPQEPQDMSPTAVKPSSNQPPMNKGEGPGFLGGGT